MLSIQNETTRVITSSIDGRPETTTNAIGQVFGQIYSETNFEYLINDIRHKKEKADYEINRPSISCLILLAHSMGLVEEIKIDDAVKCGWESIYSLYKESVSNIMCFLNLESLSIAGLDSNNSDFSDFEAMNIEIRQSQSEGVYLVLGIYPRFSQFSLLNLEHQLARAVAGCLKWTIQNSRIGMIAFDLSDGLMQDEMEALKECLDTQSHLSNSELAKFVLENDIYPFTEISEDEEYLERDIAYLKSILTNNCELMFGELPEIDEVSRMLASWRQRNHVIYHNQWVKFIRATINVWKWAVSSKLASKECQTSLFDDSHGDVPLDYGHIIGFGFDWEETLVESIHNHIAEVGENPDGIIRLNPLASFEVGERLTLLAKSRGLIRLAEIINAKMEAQVEVG